MENLAFYNEREARVQLAGVIRFIIQDKIVLRKYDLHKRN